MLVAVLLNPPVNSAGTRSRNAVERAARALGYDRAVIANLCAVPTPSVVEVNQLGRDAWDVARIDLSSALVGASAIIAAWGVSGLTGEARGYMRDQVAWFATLPQSRGVGAFWTVGGEPRHPSRWHQYVSDKYGRTNGGDFEERIAQVLVPTPVGTFAS